MLSCSSLKCLFKYIAILMISCDLAKANQAKNVINDLKHHIKWVFDDYFFPIVLTKSINKPVDADYKWFRITDSIFVDEIDNYEEYFLQSNTTPDEISLYILNYNFTGHEQLASYQPKMIAVRTDGDDSNYIIDEFNKNSEIFTLAYLKSQEIIIDDQTNPKKIDYACSVTVLFPLNEYQANLRADYNKLLQNFVYIKLILSSLDENADFFGLNSDQQIKRKRIRRAITNENKIINFLEIEIKEGPISVYKSFDHTVKRRDNISCLLKLTDSDDEKVKYEKTILKVFGKTAYPDTSTQLSQTKPNVSHANYVKSMRFLYTCTVFIILANIVFF